MLSKNYIILTQNLRLGLDNADWSYCEVKPRNKANFDVSKTYLV